MKIKSILLSILVVVVFCGCRKDDDKTVKPEDQSLAVSISIDLGALGISKSIGETSEGGYANIGQKLTIQALVSGSATEILRDVVLDKTEDFIMSGGSDSQTYTSKEGILSVPKNTRYIRVIANKDDGTKTDKISSRQGSISEPIVRVIGGGLLNSGGRCDVDLAPDMARIEVYGKMPAANDQSVRNISLKAIYINNTIMKRGNLSTSTPDRTSYNPSYTPVEGVPSWSLFVADNEKRHLYNDLNSFNQNTGITYGQGFKESDPNADTHAVGYNIFPQTTATAPTTIEDAALFHPHIIFEFVLDVWTGESWSGPGTYYLNITAFKDKDELQDKDGFIKTFKAANVYQFTLTDVYNLMNRTPSPVTSNPDPDLTGVSLTVTVSKWKENEIAGGDL